MGLRPRPPNIASAIREMFYDPFVRHLDLLKIR